MGFKDYYLKEQEDPQVGKAISAQIGKVEGAVKTQFKAFQKMHYQITSQRGQIQQEIDKLGKLDPGMASFLETQLEYLDKRLKEVWDEFNSYLHNIAENKDAY